MNTFKKEVRNITKEIIKPLSSKKENIYLLGVVIFIVLVASFLIALKRNVTYEQTINSNEISSYRKFSNIESGIYTDILNSLFDISLIKDENGTYPSVEILEEEEVSPFYKDSTWELRGSLNWSDISSNGKIYYIGISKKPKKIGNFLIEINTDDIFESNIYYSKDALLESEVLRNISHIKSHFKKIVPYTGKDERKKIKGD